ncbi:AEC family transporter [Tropicibacter sp. R15_0]|uniref:AEC family transporter n=1 Tax=Tropicibacter sp. R15_0 TaxID=2821101 RepID=UPI001ADB88FE|nr:AEC family transporter [Tropicibacter sp. R15_0]MBO9464369.1 AEC family transporter [Tropicibacter sp. R15_0]
MIFLTILNGLLPSFLMVILGGLLRNRLSENAWAGLDKLNFEILFPALIFTAAASRPIAVADMLRIAPAVWVILGVGLVLGYGARRYGPQRFLDFAGGWQTAWRFNTALGFIAVGALPGADLGKLAVAVGMAIPMANLMAVTALSRGGSLGLGATLQKIALNPFLLASLSGVAVGLSGLKIPGPVLAPVEMLAAAAIPVALISIGATMDWRALARLDRFSAILCGVKLMALPALTFLVCALVSVQTSLMTVLVVFAALPTASAAHVLAAGFGADRRLVATLIAQSTLLAALSLPVWMAAVMIWAG